MNPLLIAPLIDLAGDVFDKIFPDKEKAAQAKLEFAASARQRGDELEHKIAMAQIEVNKIEANSDDKFKSRWRPFIGWVCGVAFGWHFVGQPVVVFIAALNGVVLTDLPAFDMNTLLTVLGGLLGLGTLRTYEKLKLK